MQHRISDWNKIRDDVYKNAKDHGFWEGTPSDEHFLCLIISELMEAVAADSKGLRAEKTAFENEVKFIDDYNPDDCDPNIKRVLKSKEYHKNRAFEILIKDTVEDELADAVIRILSLAGANRINMNMMDCPMPMFPASDSRLTESIYQIVQALTVDGKPLDYALNMCRMQISKLAECMDIDISWHIQAKIKYNAKRGYRHGKKY